MSKPMTLTVYGPITPISPSVRVTGVLPTADVDILDNGTSIGHGVATNPGELYVKLTSQPTVGHSITAIQKTSEGVSEPSAQAIPVLDVPDPLPVPVIVSDLNTCMNDIRADGLVPGAQVITTIGGQPFGSTTASSTSAWLGIDPTNLIAQDSHAEIFQQVTIGGVTRKSKSVTSPNIPAFVLNEHRLPPPVLAPLVECITSREFLQVVPGAGTTITNEGQSEFWINPQAAFHGNSAPPLRQGKAVATQSMPRCLREGQPVTLTVGPATIPPAPTVKQDLCPDTPRLTVSNLTPGGILHVERRVKLDPNQSSWSIQELGDLGIAYTTQTVDLPPSVALTDPGGPVFIALAQSCCAGISPNTLVAVASLAGPFNAPTIVEPVFECSRGIPIKGAHIGADVQAFDVGSGLPISDPISVSQADFVVRPWFPLAGGKVEVRQSGCHADGRSPVVPVRALPQPPPVPTIVEPVRPQAPWIHVKDILPGAQVQLLVNNQLRPGSVDIYDDNGTIPVSGAPLADRDNLFVIQMLCNLTSNTEGHGVNVTRGKLRVSVSPAQVARGSTVNVVVTALDDDTASPVTAEVWLNGAHVGTTGVAFAYSPKAGDPNPTGVVKGGVAYLDAAFTITLVEASWALTMNAGPVPAFLESIRIEVTAITWKVTPDWNPSLAKTMTITPAPPTATSSVALPIPTGATKTVTVDISGTASTNGGRWNGYTIEPGSIVVASDSKKVAYHGLNETIAWLLKVTYTADPATGEINLYINTTLMGITP